VYKRQEWGFKFFYLDSNVDDPVVFNYEYTEEDEDGTEARITEGFKFSEYIGKLVDFQIYNTKMGFNP